MNNIDINGQLLESDQIFQMGGVLVVEVGVVDWAANYSNKGIDCLY